MTTGWVPSSRGGASALARTAGMASGLREALGCLDAPLPLSLDPSSSLDWDLAHTLGRRACSLIGVCDCLGTESRQIIAHTLPAFHTPVPLRTPIYL
ncbi:hypothetical protein BDV93DRAFT_556573 [Ceratobasidium sp. AG-I]|nr:hypothetical protein BDV93DRAFT_556573 [Ceratobasidium sp. AG-I]